MRGPCSLVAVLALGCAGRQEEPAAASATTEPQAIESKIDETAPTVEPARDDPHVVVFADRTSCAYLLLLEGTAKAPTREELTALVERKIGRAGEPEVELLRELIATEPRTPAEAAQDPGKRGQGMVPDLLGLHIEMLAGGAGSAVVEADLLLDPVLTRELSKSERASLAKRRSALLFRADYRNAHGVRGLRLLQTLVRLVAMERNALVHDPDTGETMGIEAFSRRRLQVALNVADQVMVIPFPDKRHGEPFVRLATRGMRRFGSVDLELDGLARDPELLQRATLFIHGLASVMVEAGEADRSGYGVELEPVVMLTHADVARAYRRLADLPKCAGCAGEVELHLVERPNEGHDPQDHVVARIVAPREQSDAEGYDQTAWAPSAIAKLLGD